MKFPAHSCIGEVDSDRDEGRRTLVHSCIREVDRRWSHSQLTRNWMLCDYSTFQRCRTKINQHQLEQEKKKKEHPPPHSASTTPREREREKRSRRFSLPRTLLTPLKGRPRPPLKSCVREEGEGERGRRHYLYKDQGERGQVKEDR